MSKVSKGLGWLVAGEALMLALFFSFLELMKGFRASQWSGMVFSDAPLLLVGFAAYFLVLALGTFLVAGLLCRFTPLGPPACGGKAMLAGSQGRSPYPFVLIGGLVAGAGLWWWLSQYREFTPTADDGLVLGGLVALTLGGLVFRRWRGGFHILASLVLLSGIAALFVVGEVHLFDLDRARAVTVLPVVWTASIGLVGLVFWLYHDYRVRGLFGVLALGAPLVAGHALCVAGARPAGDARPNLIFIVADSLRADYMSAYGGAVATPRLDALAREGALFEQSYSLAPWTMPSMSAMFSSGYPSSLTPGASKEAWLSQLWQYGVNSNTRGLASRLHDAGYATGAFTANTLLWSMPGMMVGFEAQGGAHPLLLVKQGVFQHFPFLQDAVSGLNPAWGRLRPSDTSDRIQRYAKAYLDRVQDRPFYMWMHYMDPHVPYDPPARYRTLDGQWPFFYPYEGGEQWGLPIIGKDFSIPESQHDYIRSLYEGEIRYVDELVGELVDELEARGLRDKTYICFTADHGEELWDHGGWEHAHTVYNELIRVPLFFVGPGVKSQRVARPVSAVELMPTLADLMGIDSDSNWRGQSLGAVVRGEASVEDKPLFAQATSNKAWPNPLQAVISDGYKLIRGAGDDHVWLYSLTDDPHETRDLAGEQPELVSAMRQLLEDWMGSFTWAFNADVSNPEQEQERIEALKSMGYL